jgi:putative protein kinase ArgK-like GTPase of G3E family
MDRSSIALTLEHLRNFLEKESRCLLSAETRSALLLRAMGLLERAASLGDLLYVGIAGGTGVGKSTLINALARKEISSPSDRRPFTDRAVVYRHRHAEPGLETIRHLIRNPDAVHDSETIRQVVLIDLPDFDSQELANRGTVLEALPVLDCVVWVTSPEKYADASLYSLVRQTGMDQRNFTFVLNKADELVGVQDTNQHKDLKEVLGDFAFRLRHEAEIEQPRIFSVSALNEFQGKGGDPKLGSEFHRFRDFLMARRDAKEIASIKSINLREEIARLVSDLNQHIPVAELTHRVKAIQQKATELPELVTGPSTRPMTHQAELSRGVLRFLIHGDASVEPVRLAMRLLTLGKGLGASEDSTELAQLFHETTQQARDTRQSHAERLANHADTELMLTLSHAEALPPLQDPASLMSEAEKEAASVFLANLETRQRVQSGFRSHFMRAGQKAWLLIPILVLVIKLVGTDAFAAWWAHPSASGGLGLGIRMLTSLFGTEGLVGLVVLLICEVGVIWYLAARRLKRLHREADMLTRDAVAQVQTCWDKVLREIAENRTQAVRKIQEGLNELEALNSLALVASGGRNPDIR